MINAFMHQYDIAAFYFKYFAAIPSIFFLEKNLCILIIPVILGMSPLFFLILRFQYVQIDVSFKATCAGIDNNINAVNFRRETN